MSVSSVVAVPASVVSSGIGVPWTNPSGATGAGIGTSVQVSITNISLTSNVVTFTTAPQQLQAGQSLVMSSVLFNTFLNGATLVVLASGLTSTSFSANFVHANVASGADIGFGTPSTVYAYSAYNSYLTPPLGQYAAYSYATTPPPGVVVASRNFFGTPFSIFGSFPYIAFFNAASLGLNSYTGSMGSFTTPTLPVGAVVQGIYLYCFGTSVGQPGAFLSFTANWNDGSPKSHSFATNGTNELTTSIGTSLSILSTLSFTHFGQATSGGGLAYQTVGDYGAIVVYAGGSGPAPGQLQTLVATQLALALPANALVTGVEVGFAAGTVIGSGTPSLQAQLTIAGSNVGTTKTVSSLTGWSSPYALGGSGDPWGTALRGVNVNGSSGLGVNISGTLASGDQINLNDLQVTVYYTVPSVVVNINVGNTKSYVIGNN